MNHAPNASSILYTAFSFWNSKVLLLLSDSVCLPSSGIDTGPELGKELHLHPRATADFFDALVAMKFLDRDRDGPEAKYGNTPEGSISLDAASPCYIVGLLQRNPAA